jgi:hypothetical protein
MKFNSIISDKVTAKVESLQMEDLGFDFEGNRSI